MLLSPLIKRAVSKELYVVRIAAPQFDIDVFATYTFDAFELIPYISEFPEISQYRMVALSLMA